MKELARNLIVQELEFLVNTVLGKQYEQGKNTYEEDAFNSCTHVQSESSESRPPEQCKLSSYC